MTVIERNVAPGIHRVDDAYVNWCTVEDGDELASSTPAYPAPTPRSSGRCGSSAARTHRRGRRLGGRRPRRRARLAQAVSLVIRRATWYLPTEARLPGVSSGLIAFSVSSAVR